MGPQRGPSGIDKEGGAYRWDGIGRQANGTAIEARGGTLLVSAAAGSGKTAVLVQRVIERLTDERHPTDADRLLVVTFTKAAAAEMRDRIAAQIALLLEEDPV